MAAGSILPMLAAAVAIVIALSRPGGADADVLNAWLGPMSLLGWIRGGSMAWSCRFVVLEIEREFAGEGLAARSTDVRESRA